MTYETFCGGIFETNCYLLRRRRAGFFSTRPKAPASGSVTRGRSKLLLLTHGHIDHVQDVARIKRQFGCQIGCHPLTAPMISDREFFRNFGFELEIEPAQAGLSYRRNAEPGFSRAGIASAGSARSLSRQPLFLFARRSIAHRRRCALCRRRRPVGFAGRRCRSVLFRNPEKNSFHSATT